MAISLKNFFSFFSSTEVEEAPIDREATPAASKTSAQRAEEFLNHLKGKKDGNAIVLPMKNWGGYYEPEENRLFWEEVEEEIKKVDKDVRIFLSPVHREYVVPVGGRGSLNGRMEALRDERPILTFAKEGEDVILAYYFHDWKIG